MKRAKDHAPAKRRSRLHLADYLKIICVPAITPAASPFDLEPHRVISQSRLLKRNFGCFPCWMASPPSPPTLRSRTNI